MALNVTKMTEIRTACWFAVALWALAGEAGAVQLVRGPYLQEVSSETAIIRWRVDQAVDCRLSIFEVNGDPLGTVVSTNRTEHSVFINGLFPNETYLYRIDVVGGQVLAGGPDVKLHMAPDPGEAGSYRIWVIGDSGTGDTNAENVRDAYLTHTGSTRTDVWLMLGDNAYNTGTDSEYQTAVFDMYTDILRNTPVWPATGNHDLTPGVFEAVFNLPEQGEAGGVPSGTERYYSFDYGNIHFVCLDSHTSDRSVGGAMLTWLAQDLAATGMEWIIAYWHHPPYSKGSHDSDNPLDSEGRMRDMRENALPILEAHGVDLVLSGHSHSYERSMLLHGHTGLSATFDADTMALDTGDGDPDGDGPYGKHMTGTVYAVAGSSGTAAGGLGNHPVMVSAHNELGSMVIDVRTNILEAVFINSQGRVRDRFRIVHAPADDSDVDGLPDAWEREWFGDTDTSDGGDTDTDSDGVPDVEEYHGETSPIDPASFLRLFIETTTSGQNIFSWQQKANRSYSIEGTTNILTVPWTTRYSSLSNGTFTAPVGAPEFLTYRIRIEPKP